MHDVAIIGGGLAGLTLALQLRQQAPEQSVVVIERNTFPAPLAAHKVGEATVEIGAHYLSHTLGLHDYLEREHLRKFGLRLFFGAGRHADLAAADELGASSLLPAISYQLDRGRLENDLADQLLEHGGEIRTGCVVKGVEVGPGAEEHSITIEENGERSELHCRWLVDASARAGILKRELGLAERLDHRMCAAWFRIDDDFSVDDWSADADWLGRCAGKSRRPSTNHLVGRGYWIWIIPLAGGITSVGVVADPEIHPLSTFDNWERMVAWLQQHQPTLARQVAASEPIDFLKLKNLSHGCSKTWSADRWAVTGEAGFFADPFYSPGTDFIALSNTFITDLIVRDCSDAERGVRASIYEKMYRSFFESTMSLYEGQYAGFGDARLMAIKLTWDYCYYWSVLAWLYFRDVLTDLNFLRQTQADFERIRALNDDMQARFRERAREAIEDTGNGRFFDQIAVPMLVDLNGRLLVDSDDRVAELKQNCADLEDVAKKLLALLDGQSIGMCPMLGDLEARLAIQHKEASGY